MRCRDAIYLGAYGLDDCLGSTNKLVGAPKRMSWGTPRGLVILVGYGRLPETLPSIRRVSHPPGLPANNWGSRIETVVRKTIAIPKAKIVYYCNDVPCGFVGVGMRGGVLPNRPNMLEEF